MITKKNDSKVALLQIFISEVEMRDKVNKIHYSEQNKQLKYRTGGMEKFHWLTGNQ